MKQVIKIHIEHELEKEEIEAIQKMTEEEINERLRSTAEYIKNEFEEFPEESIKQLDVFLVKD